MYVESTFFERMIRKIRQATFGRLLLDRNDCGRTVFLAGTGRSGTTWIANVLNYDNSYRLMFEPFNPQEVDAVRQFRYRQYLRPDNRDRRFLDPAGEILSGRIRDRWIDGLNKKLFASKRIVKDIRAHLLLRWIKTNFPEIPIILLLRHPCAVAYSKMELNWATHLDEFLSQADLVRDFLQPFKTEVSNAESTFDKHIFLWCIENYVPLKQFQTGEIHLAFYEYFCTRPEQEVDRLFKFLDQPYDQRVFEAIRKPSTLSRKKSAIRAGKSLTHNWTHHIPEAQIERAVEILSLFGLDGVYSKGGLPLVSGERNPLAD